MPITLPKQIVSYVPVASPTLTKFRCEQFFITSYMWSAIGFRCRGSHDCSIFCSTFCRNTCEILSSFSAPGSRKVVMALLSSARCSCDEDLLDGLPNTGEGSGDGCLSISPLSLMASKRQNPSAQSECFSRRSQCGSMALNIDLSLAARTQGDSRCAILRSKSILDFVASLSKRKKF